MDVDAKVYISNAIMISTIICICGIILSIYIFFSTHSSIFSMLALLSTMLISGCVFVFIIKLPLMRAQERAKKIDASLPFAVNFARAISTGIKPFDTVAERIALQKIFGELQIEFSYIVRDIKLLGKDLISALQNAMQRTPSEKLKIFLQGIVTVVTSGGDLNRYLSAKADEYISEARVEQKNILNSMTVVGEGFVTIAVACPLFLIVLISVMAMLSSAVQSVLVMLYFIVLVILPVVHAGFIMCIKSVSRYI